MTQVVVPSNLGNDFDLGVNEPNKIHIKLDGTTIKRDGLTGALYAPVKPFFQARRITSNQLIGVNTDLIFNQEMISNGLTINTTNGIFSLTANKTYSLQVLIQASNFSSNAGWARCSFVNTATNLPLYANALLEIRPFTATTASSVGDNLELLYTPTSNINVKVRCIASSGATFQMRQDVYSGIIVREL